MYKELFGVAVMLRCNASILGCRDIVRENDTKVVVNVMPSGNRCPLGAGMAGVGSSSPRVSPKGSFMKNQ